MPRSAWANRRSSSSGAVALPQAVFLRDQAFPPQVENVVVEQHHAVPRTGLNRRRDAENLVLANQVGDAGRHDQRFERRHAPAADFLQQLLAQDADDRRRQLRANLFLLVRRETRR